MTSSFDALLAEGESRDLRGWDFTWLAGRMVEEPPAFDYLARARERIADAGALLDLGTGGGEVLFGLAPLPAKAIATEAYGPNVPIAARRLAPLDAWVVQVEGAPENWETLATPRRAIPALPFADRAFDLVIDRHESYLAAEVLRVLRPGGAFVTQQCGGAHHAQLNTRLGLPPPRYGAWNLRAAADQLRAAGFDITAGREQFTTTRFGDVGAIVSYLRALPWQAPGFSAAACREALKTIHERIEREGPLGVRAHHFLIEAIHPLRP